MDRSRIYSAVDADEIKPGTEGVFGDTLDGVLWKVMKGELGCVAEILSPSKEHRFADKNDLAWGLFLPIEEADAGRMVEEIANALHCDRAGADILRQLDKSTIIILHLKLLGKQA